MILPPVLKYRSPSLLPPRLRATAVCRQVTFWRCPQTVSEGEMTLLLDQTDMWTGAPGLQGLGCSFMMYSTICSVTP